MLSLSWFRNGIVLAMFACAATAPAVHAQTYFGTNASIDYALTNDVNIGYASAGDRSSGVNPTSPTVNVVAGGSIGGGMDVLNNSTVNFNGGIIYSTISNYNISVTAENTSTVNVSSGTVRKNIQAFNNGRVNISGGTVHGNLFSFDSSTFNISGGTIEGDLTAHSGSIVNISGGSIIGLQSKTGDLSLYENSTLNLFGTNLSAVFTNHYNGDGLSQYVLGGALADGTSVNGKFLYVLNGGNAHFILNNSVPEPGSVALLIGLTTTGAGFLSRRRRQQAKNAA